MIRVLFVLMAFVISSPAFAKMYKCKVDGRVVYQDVPCRAGATEKELAPPPTVSPQAAAEAEIRAQRDISAVRRAELEEDIDRRQRARQAEYEAKISDLEVRRHDLKRENCLRMQRSIDDMARLARQYPGNRSMRDSVGRAQQRYAETCL